MNLRTAAAVGAAFGILGVGSAFATFARVESMGKNTTYIMDDVSIFDNPANANLYSNYLIGGFGAYTDNDLKAGGNVDPQHPTFGGIFSVSFGDDNNPDPKFTIGGLFGRINQDLAMYLPDYVQVGKRGYVVVPETVTNFDGFLGGTFSSGDAWGLHIYIAHQDGGDLDESGTYQPDSKAYASLVQLDGGLNFQLGSGTSYELSGGVARIQYGPDRHDFFDDGDFSILGKARAFFTLEAIDGELVPAANIKLAQAPGIEDKLAQAGMGINVAMDRGFFWLGLDFIWNQTKAHDWFYDKALDGGAWVYDSRNEDDPHWDKRSDIGGKISFGIERNIWWDWFVIRVGGQKSILYTDCDVNSKNEYTSDRYGICKDDGTFFSTNPLADGSADDHVGFGFGINIEERLKIDVTVAEDLLFRNPFQGEGRFFSRLDATYSF
ncbi:MAG: hypothetical protein IJ912_00835 [Fibrobacter sp.]|jgi:hypothetical protein|nr:hypothetical protein [Fibrobacter sp.]MBR6834304.1 hypothetical protein [Fibrobacter sp.]